jgi:hypothetical protein
VADFSIMNFQSSSGKVQSMKLANMKWIVASCFVAILLAFTAMMTLSKARASEPSGRTVAASGQETDVPPAQTPTQKANIEGYRELLQENVPDQKEQLIGATLQLSAADADKFWPIYAQYETDLSALNAQAAKATSDFVSGSGHMNDQSADEVVHALTQYETQRAALMDKYYGRVKQAVGADTAARFYEVESQLVSLTDLQRNSSLPVAE